MCGSAMEFYRNIYCRAVILTVMIYSVSASGCGRVFNNTLLSPGYPNNYPYNMDCVYSVDIPDGMAMKIFFNYFFLGSHDTDCSWSDYLSIENNQDFGKYCGVRSGESVIVIGRYVNISFHSGPYLWRNGRRYNLSFSLVPLVGCGRVSNNTLLSPGYPNNYARYRGCVYSVDIVPGMAIKIFFNYFELEDHPSCRHHYLSIKNGNNKDFGKYCGVRSGESVIVTGRYVKISFHSGGGSNNRRGYNVSFSVVPSVGYCSDLDLGMQSGSIPDNRITASSQLNNNTPAKNGRLNYAAGSSWCASTNDSNPYLQIDLQTLHIICAVSTQGNAKADEWVETYTLQTSTDGKNWSDYKNGEQVEVLRGNVDSNTTNKNFIYLGVLTRWMRFLGTARHVAFCMRVEVFGVKQKPENIAAGKVTEQSSTHSNNSSNGASAKAVDGNSDPDFNNGHCSRTLEDSPSWWRVDLGNRMPVFEVRIVNRLVWSSNRSLDLSNRDYKITLGDSPNVTANTECVGNYSFPDFIASAVCYMRVIGPNVNFGTGRYVGIMTTRKQFLELCEVEIYSRDNMAFNKAAEQSNTLERNSASRAVDGNINTHSETGNDNHAWWRVDLGREEHVSAVYIFSYAYYSSFDIRVGSVTNAVSGPLCATVHSFKYDLYESRTFFCRPTLYGKYVTITGMERNFLRFYEVEVYSARRASQIQEVGVTSLDEIPRSCFTASSSRPGNERDNEPDQARLNFRDWSLPNRAWLPSTNSNPSDYLQIHLQYVFFICAVATQGNPNADEWTTKYKLLLSLDETTWITYKENGTEKIFNGNNGRSDVVKHNLVETARASIVRFQPTEYRSHKALRVELYGTIVPAVPHHPPKNLQLTAQTSTSVIASWHRPSKRKITGYKLFYRKQGSQDSLTTLTTSSSTQATVANLIKYTKYEFQVLAFNHFGDGPNSSFKVVRTKEDVPSEAPRNLTATAASSTSVVTTWQLPATDSRHGIIKGFKLFYKTKGSDINSTTTFLFESADILTKTVFGLDEFTEYEFQVLAFTSVGDGPKSAVVIARTKEDVPSQAPTSFNVTAQASSRVTASWQLPPADARNGNITGFKLFYTQQGVGTKCPTILTINISANPVTNVSGLKKYTEYEFQVLAFTSVGDGPKGEGQVVKTKEDVPSEAPTGLSATSSTSASIFVAWQPPANDSHNGIIRGFKLFVKRKDSDKARNTSVVTSVSNPQKNVTGLDEVTEYEFQVLAFTSAGDGMKSPVVVARTKERKEDVSLNPTGVSLLRIREFLIVGFSLVALLVLGIMFYRKIKQQTKRTAKDIQLLDPAEIPPLRIEIVEELGQGAFGKVSKSKLKDGLDYFVNSKHIVKTKRKEQFVAVKELFENANEEQKKEFLDEINLMKRVGKHPNVLSFLGCWTTTTPLRLIIEYISHGDLLHWLRSKRSQLSGSTLGASLVVKDEKCYAGRREQNRTDDQENEGEGRNSTGEFYKNTRPSNSKREEECDDNNEHSCSVPLIVFSGNEGEGRNSTEEFYKNTRPSTSKQEEECDDNNEHSCSVPLIVFSANEGEGQNSKEEFYKNTRPSTSKQEEECFNDDNEHSCSIPLIVFSAPDQDQDPEAPTQTSDDECDQNCNSFDSIDILKFAWQIARGMSYLSGKGLVHRDLAARNILVGHGKRLKIGDFGLMRQLYSEVYEGNKQKKLPIKWMAPEAILDGIFSVKSDVWSYGVVLWEIGSLGGSPYPLLGHRQIVANLKGGYRMEKPDICPESFYSLMTDCWKQIVHERPNFEELENRVERMLLQEVEYFDMSKLDESKEYYKVQDTTTAETSTQI